jgi:hypothetical protein
MSDAGYMTTPSSITGRCECGAVRFTVTGAMREVINCHCKQCRRLHGHFAAYTSCALGDLSFAEQRGLRWYQSSSFARRGFCGECGASLFWQKVEGDSISVAAGCLDAPTGLRSARHIFTAHRGDYYEIADGLEQFANSDD